MVLDRMLVVRTSLPLWAHEQALRSGAASMALAWLPRASPRAVRRLQLAAEQCRALGVLYRSQRFADEASPAMLRLLLEPLAATRRFDILQVQFTRMLQTGEATPDKVREIVLHLIGYVGTPSSGELWRAATTAIEAHDAAAGETDPR